MEIAEPNSKQGNEKPGVVRALAGVGIPMALTGFMCWMFGYYVIPLIGLDDDVFAAAPRGGEHVFYVWFVVAVLGLGVAKWCLQGIEARMPSSENQLDALYVDIWSGPGGWCRAVGQLFTGRHLLSAKEWIYLTGPSLLILVGLSLSGSAMEPSDGFVPRRKPLEGGVKVKGFTWKTFNERRWSDAIDGATTIWENAIGASVPELGAIYTPPGDGLLAPSVLAAKELDFSDFFEPAKAKVGPIFLTAQGESPIEGNSWGLQLQYECSIVRNVTDFTVLRLRNSSDTVPPSMFEHSSSDAQFFTANLTGDFVYGNNLLVVAEFGYQIPQGGSSDDNADSANDDDDESDMFSQCYFQDYPGIDNETVFEMVIWQGFLDMGRGTASLSNEILELRGKYNTSASPHFLDARAIGVRCSSSSSVGTADIRAVRPEYRNFVRTDTGVSHTRFEGKNQCATRFGAWSIYYLFKKLMTPVYFDKEGVPVVDWMGRIFSSVSAPPPWALAHDRNGPNFLNSTYEYALQMKYLQPEELRESLFQVHAAYATELMFAGGMGQGSTAWQGEKAFVNPNVTDYEPGRVLKPGPISPFVPIVFVGLWMISTIVLSCIYRS